MHIDSPVAGYRARWSTDPTDTAALVSAAHTAYQARGCGSAASPESPPYAALLITDPSHELCAGFAVRLLDGVRGSLIEATLAWASSTEQRDVRASELLAANSIVALAFTGARRMVCTSADHSTGLWTRSGARPIEPAVSQPYPTPDYSTIRLAWEADGLPRRMDHRLLQLAIEQAAPHAWIRERLVALGVNPQWSNTLRQDSCHE